jgi:hypothetical protein
MQWDLPNQLWQGSDLVVQEKGGDCYLFSEKSSLIGFGPGNASPSLIHLDTWPASDEDPEQNNQLYRILYTRTIADCSEHKE